MCTGCAQEGRERNATDTVTARALACAPGKTDQIFFDEDLPGFGLRVRASGAKTWTVKYDIAGKSRRISLGPPTVLSADPSAGGRKESACQGATGRRSRC
jgi:hypothetical protein